MDINLSTSTSSPSPTLRRRRTTSSRRPRPRPTAAAKFLKHHYIGEQPTPNASEAKEPPQRRRLKEDGLFLVLALEY